MNTLLGLAVLIGIAFLALRIYWGTKAEQKFEQMRADLNDPHAPDYTYQGYVANRVGEPSVRVVVAIYRNAKQIRFILDPPRRDIQMSLDHLVEVSEAQYETIGKIKDEVAVITHHPELPEIRVQAWERDLYVNLRSASG